VARLGLVPAAIATAVFQAMGRRRAVAHMLRAAPFGVDEALAGGLIHEVADREHLDAALKAVIDDLLRGAPGALATIKRLPDLVAAGAASPVNLHVTRATSDEGREGLAAFLDKRPAAWVPRSQGERK